MRPARFLGYVLVSLALLLAACDVLDAALTANTTEAILAQTVRHELRAVTERLGTLTEYCSSMNTNPPAVM